LNLFLTFQACNNAGIHINGKGCAIVSNDL
jgi:hypothetical protein